MIGFADKGGEGVQNPKNFADVLNGSPLTESNCFKSVSEVLKTGAAIAKNPGAAVDIVKTGVEVVKKGAQILPNPKDFKDLAKLVEAASSGK